MTNPEKNDARPGIRAGVWFAVLSLLFLCLVSISLSRRHPPRTTGDIAARAEEAVRQESTNDRRVNARRRARADAASDEGEVRFSAGLTVEEATSKALRVANERGEELFGCEPFEGRLPAIRQETGWVWSERRSQGTADIEATVHLGADGSVQSVDVLLLPSVLPSVMLRER